MNIPDAFFSFFAFCLDEDLIKYGWEEDVWYENLCPLSHSLLLSCSLLLVFSFLLID